MPRCVSRRSTHRFTAGPRNRLAAIADFYALDGRPPSLWRPEDRAWCVGTDVDLITAYVGASDACVAALLAEQQLEVLAVAVEQLITWDADTLNPLPADPY
jgi:hypothetical protein